jgi:hypothetical protein
MNRFAKWWQEEADQNNHKTNKTTETNTTNNTKEMQETKQTNSSASSETNLNGNVNKNVNNKNLNRQMEDGAAENENENNNNEKQKDQEQETDTNTNTSKKQTNTNVTSTSTATQNENTRLILIEEIPTNHHFKTHPSPIGSTVSKLAVRLSVELETLKQSLPNGIWLVCFENRMDLFRALVSGAEGTPYEHSLFLFDIALPSSYPKQPPLVFYHSYGERLHPNLHKEGKVCCK